MEIKYINKGRTEKTVMVKNTEGVTDEEVIAFATEKAGETPTSLFGTSLFRYEVERDEDDVETCHVYLYTD